MLVVTNEVVMINGVPAILNVDATIVVCDVVSTYGGVIAILVKLDAIPVICYYIVS